MRFSLLCAIMLLPVHLFAQYIRINEGMNADQACAKTLSDGYMLVGLNANYRGEDYNNFTIVKLDSLGKSVYAYGNRHGSYRKEQNNYSSDKTRNRKIGDLLELPDGKIIITGTTEGKIFLCRLLADGTEDQSFGREGYVVYNDMYADNALMRIYQGSDGNLLIGYIYDGSYGCFKSDVNGQLVQSYGNNGHTGFDNRFRYIEKNFSTIGKDSKDRIYLAVNQYTDSTRWINIYRVNPDGSMDMKYGDQGVMHAASGNGYDLYYKTSGMAFLPDQSLLFPVAYSLKKNDRFTAFMTLRKFREDGSPDTTFGKKGELFTKADPAGSAYSSVYVLPDGKIMYWTILESYEKYSDDHNFLVLTRRLTQKGAVDKTFGNKGVSVRLLQRGGNNVNLNKAYYDGRALYVYGDGEDNGDEWPSLVIRMKNLANNLPDSPTGNEASYKESLAAEGLFVQIGEGFGGGGSVADLSAQGNKGVSSNRPTEDENRYVEMIRQFASLTEDYYKKFKEFDSHIEGSSGLVRQDINERTAEFGKVTSSYTNKVMELTSGKTYNVRPIWKDNVKFSTFNGHVSKLLQMIKKYIDNLNKSVDYASRFFMKNNRMPSSLQFMEQADYTLDKFMKEFIQRYKYVSLQ